jgi:hypothetical protein
MHLLTRDFSEKRKKVLNFEKIYDKISGEEVESLSRRLFLSPSVKNHNAEK